MSAPRHILNDFLRWCDECAHTRQVEKHKLPGTPTRVLCRTCLKVLAIEGGESDGQDAE